MPESGVLSRQEAGGSGRPRADAQRLAVARHEGVIGPRKDREKIALMFHGVGDVPAGVSIDERPYWISRSFFLDILAVVKNREFERDVVLTFDDGNSSDLFVASELARAGLKGHFFLLAGRLGVPGFLDPSAARDIARAGMEVGLHGHSHVDWRRNSPVDWQREVCDARRRIAEAIGRPVDEIAIPFGYYNRAVLRQLEGDGFHRIYNSDPGPTPAGSKVIRRTPVMSDSSVDGVIDIIEDKCGLLQRVRRAVVPVIKSWR